MKVHNLPIMRSRRSVCGKNNYQNTFLLSTRQINSIYALSPTWSSPQVNYYIINNQLTTCFNVSKIIAFVYKREEDAFLRVCITTETATVV